MRAPEFWSRDDAVSRIAAAALAPIGLLYGASVAWRSRLARPYRPTARVVCVGNLTAGGTGKTPVAIAVAKALESRGLKAVFLSRGYGGREPGPLLVDPARHDASDVGDEPLLLARHAPVIVSRDRRAGAVLADKHGAEIIVMDDGHQNFSLEKDLSFVVIDAANPFDNGRMIPAGPLREPVAQGLARADAVVALGQGKPDLGAFGGAVLCASLQPDAGISLLRQRVLAFAGIGRPEKFFATLRTLGADLVDTRGYADHHAYSATELARLKSAALANEARLITTEKDHARMSPDEREGIDVLPVRVVFEDAAGLAGVLDRLNARRHILQ